MLPAKLQRPFALAAPVLYMAAIFVQSSFPLPEGPESLPDHVDKVIHLLEYGLLGFLLQRGIAVGLRRPEVGWWVAGTIGAVYGCTDELHQLFVPGRSASFGDAAADIVGSLVAAWLAARVLSGRESRSRAAPAG